MEHLADTTSAQSILLYVLVLYLVGIGILTAMYLSPTVNLTQNAEDFEFLPRDGFSDEIFDCVSQPKIAVASFCCPFARWGDTLSILGLMQFNAAVAVWMICGVIDLAYLFPAGVVILVVFGAYHRSQIRVLYKLPQQSCCDLVAWIFCIPCAIAQEARHVERSRYIREGLKHTPKTFYGANAHRNETPSQPRLEL